MRRVLVLCVCWIVCGCSTPEDDCAAIDTDCTPQYEPTFDNIHGRTLTGSCATSGGSCHATPTALGGFSLADVDAAYDELSSRAGECGSLVSRVTSTDRNFQMPPGAPLSDGEQCAILQWVEAGSPRESTN